MRLRVIIAVVDGPDTRPGAEIENGFDVGVGVVGRGETELVVKGESEEVVLQV